MPRTALPPTPASSTDIRGKDGTRQLSSLQMAFELPEPAILNAGVIVGAARTGPSFSPVSPVSTTSPKPPYPIQPSEAVKSRRRFSAAAAAVSKDSNSSSGNSNCNAFALPPPPTRSRKIIQMKPRALQDQKKTDEMELTPAPITTTTTTSGKGAGKRMAAGAATRAVSESGPPSKKKQPSATSAAGRKIARKTAHSLIERRRRSKMNEEFAVLKGMIPACTGEMHKLAILQASIEYVRYLQDCIEKLQSRESQTPAEKTGMLSSFHPAPYNPEGDYLSHQQTHAADKEDDNEDDEDEEQQHSPDVEMANSEDIATPSPTFTSMRPSSATTTACSSHHHQPSISPALAAHDAAGAIHHHGSYASLHSAVAHSRHYSLSSCTAPSALGPSWGGGHGAPPPPRLSNPGSTLTSPALGPLRERDLDQEATAALLMLNSDRRGTVARDNGDSANSGSRPGAGRGMSVRDLLSA